MRDALGRGPLGFSSEVLAFSVGTGYFRALRQRAGQAAQETDRVGVAVAFGGKALAPGAQDRGRGRRHLRRPRTARPLPETLQSHHLHNPLTVARRPLRASSATPSRSDRQTALEG